jgi:hypothetical protein
MRQKYGIATLRRWERWSVPPLAGELKSLLVGSMLGDAWMTRKDSAVNLTESHCEAQKGYLDWKVSLWGTWICSYSGPHVASKKAFPGQPQYSFSTHPHGSLVPWCELFYPIKKKAGCKTSKQIPPVGLETHMDAFALAIWYQDDGTAHHWPTLCMKKGKEPYALPLLQSLGLQGTISSGGVSISGTRNANLFLEMIREHMHPDLQYKLQVGFLKGAFYQQYAALKQDYWDLKLRESTDQIQTLRAQGCTPEQVAKELGVTEQRFQTFIQQQGITFEEWRYGYSDSQLAQVQELAGTIADKQLAIQMSLSPDIVARLRKHYKIPPCKRYPQIEELLPRLQEALAQAGSIRNLAQLTGISEGAISHLVKKHAIPYLKPQRKTGTEALAWNRWRAVLDEKDLEDRAPSMTVQELSSYFMVQVGTIQRRLKALGLCCKASRRGRRPSCR